jgi:hypothetical protein
VSHRRIIKTKKYAVEVCKEDRQDFVVIRLWSGSGKSTVHHHLKPREAAQLAHGLLTASNSKPT